MSLSAYQKSIEERAKKDQEILELKEGFVNLEESFRLFREWVSSRNREGRLEKIRKLKEQLASMPDSNDAED